MGELLVGAEEEFLQQKYGDAFDMACLARVMYPEVRKVKNYMAAYGIHLGSTAIMNNGESDWYNVLGVRDYSVPTKTLREHYCQLAKLVHPELNESVAADGAFKLINKAWEVLGDNQSRLAYHIRCGWRPPPPKPDTGGCYVVARKRGAVYMKRQSEHKRQRPTLG